MGLPVVTLNRGTRIYDVEDMILDPERRQVLALVVQEKSWFHSARALPFGRIHAIGPDAVIIPDGRAIIDVDRDPVLRRLDNDQIVKGLRVLTEDGRRLGQVDDMLIDDKTGEIKGFYVSIGRVLNVTQGLRWLPADRVISMGLRIMYVPPDVAADFEAQTGGWAGALDQAGGGLKAAGARLNEQLVRMGEQARQRLPEQIRPAVVGRTAQRTVTDDTGTIIVNQGDVVTEEQFDAARQAGKLPQLLAAVAPGPAITDRHLDTVGEQIGQSLADIRTEARTLWDQITGRYTQAVDAADERMVQRRIKFALGRPVTRVILDENDNVILNTGDIITHRAVEAARAAGVLDILLESVYTDKPKLDLNDLKAPTSGTASLTGIEASGGMGGATGPVEPVQVQVQSGEQARPAPRRAPARH
jgi:uncharacterized protein YrrD